MHELERPLVTLAVFAFNQEKLIAAAVEAALAQDYSPLEILLSDDCSDDRTFEVMENIAARYKGRHRIVLNRNPANLGVGGHVNRVMELAKGELVVGAAGDDISVPQRVTRLVDFWVGNAKKADSLCSDLGAISPTGEAVGKVIRGKPFEGSLADGVAVYFSGIAGAAHAWTPRVFDRFGGVLPDSVCEDRIIPLRSRIMGGALYVPEPLVMYRLHRGNISRFGHTKDEELIAKTLEIYRRNLNILDNYLRDLRAAERMSLVTLSEADAAIAVATHMRDKIGKKIEFICASPLRKVRMILQSAVSEPMLAVKWTVMLVAPFLYLRQQRNNLRPR